ncbi:MAG: hypothetical protein HQM01_10605, partial [Magnetococcales bacterium]|nr:hypothetical protein [Magnetococcales bacterium]
MTRSGWILLLGLLFLAGNLAIQSDEPFIPPSRMFLDPEFSYKWHHYTQRPQVDYLILGNSRSKPLDPNTLAQELSQPGKPPVTVHSLSVGGGYFPFYHELMNRLGADHPPKTLILSVSPRDFKWRHRLANSVREQLLNSSGHALRVIQYAAFFRWLEAKSADSIAATMPLLYYRQRVLALLVPDALRAWSQPRWESKQSYWQQATWKTVQNLETPNSFLPHGPEAWLRRLRGYPERLAALVDWQPPAGQLVDSVGALLPAPLSPDEERQRAELKSQQWRDQQPIWEQTRLDPGCQQTFVLEDQRGQTLQRQFLAALQARGIRLFFVIVPAVRLEGCENNRVVQRQWLE